MKKLRSILATIAMLAFACSSATAAALLAVKPVDNNNSVSVEISADIPMTYTFYNIPGQPRAVVDIANADPENVEPLIVVNKGVVSSISVDKAQIAGMLVSRIVFNLVTESKISVTASPDRKILTATFGETVAATPAAVAFKTKPQQVPEAKQIELKQPALENKPTGQAEPSNHGTKDEDPLGLDEQFASPTSTDLPAVNPVPATPANKLEPFEPATLSTTPVSIEKIVTGDTYIEIQTNGTVGKYKIMELTKPERIVIDIPDSNNALTTKSVSINKFGITRARIGINPGFIRIVLDSSKSSFPKHTITNESDALRITFK